MLGVFVDKLRQRIEVILTAIGPVPDSTVGVGEPIYAKDVVPFPVLIAAQDLLEHYGIISVHGLLKSRAGLERLLLAINGRFQTTLVVEGTDEGVVELPPEMLALSGWREGDVLEIEQRPDGIVVIRKPVLPGGA